MTDQTDVQVIGETGLTALPEMLDISNLAGTLNTVAPVEEMPENPGGYLPYVALAQGQSPFCQDPFNFPSGSLIIVQSKDKANLLGKQFDCVLIDWRNKALFIDKKDRKNTYVSYDEEAPEFQDIVAKQAAKVKGASWGIDFLVIGSDGNFYTFFCNNPTLRNNASGRTPSLKEYMRKPTTITVDKIVGDEYTWFGVKPSPCSNFPAIQISRETMLEQIERFKNPQTIAEAESAPVETADAATETDR